MLFLCWFLVVPLLGSCWFLVVPLLGSCCSLVDFLLFPCWQNVVFVLVFPSKWHFPEMARYAFVLQTHLVRERPKTLKRQPALRIRAGDKLKHRVTVHIQIKKHRVLEILETVKLAFIIV